MRTGARIAMMTTALVGVAVAVAWAHTSLVRSDPAKDARLTWPPTVLRLEFSEAVAPATSRVELVSPDSLRLSLTLRADTGGNRKVILADVPALVVPGRYRVDWRLIGADGHAVTGQYSFTVDSIVRNAAVRSPAPPVQEPAPQVAEGLTTSGPLQVLVRFLSTLALVTVIGATAFALLILPRLNAPGAEPGSELHRSVDGRLRSLARAGAWSMLVLAAIRLTSQAAVLGGSFELLRVADITGVLRSSWGHGWLLYVAGTVTALIALSPSRRTRDRSPWPWVAAACAALALASPLLGHPAAAEPAVVAIGLDAVHVMAAGGWGGTLLAVTLVAIPQATLLRGDQRANAVRSLLRAFTPLALTCAAVLMLTGAMEAWLQLGSISALWESQYGLALVRKLVLVMLVAALGAWHWRVAQPGLGSDRSIVALRRSVGLEVAFLLAVLVLTAVLTGTGPPE